MTITKYGGIYDCVDFYKQPAFDHPLMKNHTFHPQVRFLIVYLFHICFYHKSDRPLCFSFNSKCYSNFFFFFFFFCLLLVEVQMRPSYSQERIKASSSNEKTIKCRFRKLQGGGCPTGTVPIKRVNKDDRNQIKSSTKDYLWRRNPNSIQPEHGHHVNFFVIRIKSVDFSFWNLCINFAIVQTNSDPSTTKCYGATGIFNDYRLSIRASQYSSGEMIFQNGNDMIKVGWTAGQYNCFNTLCPGFVSTNKDIPIDSELVPSSKRGGIQRSISLFVYQDVENKNWWLELCGIVVGFWPHQIFTAMQDAATYVAVGGEAYGPPGQPLPPMGNGYYPSEELVLTAYCRNFTILDANRQYINPQQIERFAPEWRFGVYNMGIYKNRGRTICYGGTTL
ncbi:uncharacterized protein LOC104898746 [Beta vulgaris subsp. vulgaris]|uniref:uncharacterized protein LOC104898746 n=1 Tax=Beta vulgaris subsp. vulgaris TaxID=3555 RepID=UPI0025475E58|nr:uncharacterized protein LOC104898746 [Beta vulgaris subsp. vulgaris]